MNKYPKQARAFMNAYVRGLRDYNDAFEKNRGKAEVIDILTKYTRIKDKDAYASVVPVGLSPNGALNVQSLKDDARWYLQQGYLKKMPDIDAIVDLSYAQRAVKALGEYN